MLSLFNHLEENRFIFLLVFHIEKLVVVSLYARSENSKHVFKCFDARDIYHLQNQTNKPSILICLILLLRDSNFAKLIKDGYCNLSIYKNIHRNTCIMYCAYINIRNKLFYIGHWEFYWEERIGIAQVSTFGSKDQTHQHVTLPWCICRPIRPPNLSFWPICQTY